MSDLCLYEYQLENIAWDEFCLSVDHIVPHASSERANKPLFQSDSRKKPHHEVIDLSRTIDQSAINYAQRKIKVLPPLNSRSTAMLEKDSSTDVPDARFPSKHDKDPVEEVSSLASENTRTSNHCLGNDNINSASSEFHPNDLILDDKNTAVGENSYSYQLGPISQSDDLSFFDSNHGDKNTNDLLYYSWPEIENFEDVDRMLRSCDSAFGLGASIEDDLGWVSSSDVIQGSGGGSRSDFQFPCPTPSELENISGSLKDSRPKETCSSMNEFCTKEQPLSHSGSSLPLENESAILSHLSFVNGSSDSDCKMIPEKKIDMRKKNSKHQNQSEGKRKVVSLENGEAFNYIDSLPEEIKHPTAITGSQVHPTSTGVQQQKQVGGLDSVCFQRGFSNLHSDYSHSDQTTVEPMESSRDPSFQVVGVETNEKVEKRLYHSGIKFENNSDLEGVSMRIPAEFGSSIAKESSLINSAMDGISEEAASFHQLQHVTERLDTRTKLRIRDSLYRLAQSAEQRHMHANLTNGSGDDRCTGGFVDIGPNRCAGYLDMETDTNSIDRSIAHLLFHRPSNNSPLMPGSDSMALESPPMIINEQIYGSLTSPPMMGEDLISAGENATKTDRGVD